MGLNNSDYKKSAARKYLIGVHSNGLIIDPKTNKPTITHIRARSNCKWCHGRGFEGWYRYGSEAKLWVCKCFVKTCAQYADKHGVPLKDIKTELMVDEEKSDNKIKVVGGLNATGILGDTGRTARV